MLSKRLFTRHSLTRLTIASGLAVAACSGDAPSSDAPSVLPEVVQSQVALTAFDGCMDLERYLEDSAIQQVNVHLESLKDYENSWWGRGPILTEDAAIPASAPNDNMSAPTDFTQTNVQVEGVDEADFVKTNGTQIFVLSGQKLYMAKSWPADEMALQASIEIDGYPSEMFLDEEGRIVVFSYYYPGRDADSLYHCQWGCGSRVMTKVTVLSTAGEQLTPVHEVYLHGSYANARRIGSSVRIVLRDYLPLPDGVRWYPEFNADPRTDPMAWSAAIDRLKANNAALIRARTLADWLPQDYYVTADGTEQPLPRDCASFSRVNASVRLGVATIGTLNLAQSGISIDTTSILGEVGEVYASRSSLYVANPHWWWWPVDSQQSYTYLHKFDISNPSRAVYRASGVVAGYPLNQFAMDEHNGYLRVATTIDRWRRTEDRDSWWFDNQTFNRVTVMGDIGGYLMPVGQTRDLAEDERITSARFIGDKGYLVTFEQIDPLFTVDLSDPRLPRVVGELKIPGFSSYLHPLDENHLLAIGVDLPEPDENGRVDWSQRAMKLSVFDVSNFEQPREKFVARVGTAYGWSEAAWNHKAFNYFPARQMLAIPFSDYLPNTDGDMYWEHFVSDLKLFHVDVETGFQARGAVNLGDIYRRSSYRRWTWYWSPWVRRSVMADDFAYAISDAGIRAADMRSPAADVSTVLFDDAYTRQ